jgi:OOP family OmpA-OmpF porin
VASARSVKAAVIEGYTDAKGTAAYNQHLSERRAAAVYDWLSTHGDLERLDLHVVCYGAASRVPPISGPMDRTIPKGAPAIVA